MDPKLFQDFVQDNLCLGRKRSAGPKTATENVEQPILVARSRIRPCELCLEQVLDPRSYIMTNQIGPGRKSQNAAWIQKCLVCSRKFPYNSKNNK